MTIEVQLGKETQKGDAEKVSSKNNSYKWVEVNFDFLLNASNRDAKIKIKLLDTKANEPLGILDGKSVLNFSALFVIFLGEDLRFSFFEFSCQCDC